MKAAIFLTLFFFGNVANPICEARPQIDQLLSQGGSLLNSFIRNTNRNDLTNFVRSAGGALNVDTSAIERGASQLDQNQLSNLVQSGQSFLQRNPQIVNDGLRTIQNQIRNIGNSTSTSTNIIGEIMNTIIQGPSSNSTKIDTSPLKAINQTFVSELANTGLQFLRDNEKIVKSIQDGVANLGNGTTGKIIDSGLKFVREGISGRKNETSSEV